MKTSPADLLRDAQNELKLTTEFLSTVKSRKLQHIVRHTLLKRLPSVRRRIRRALRILGNSDFHGHTGESLLTGAQSSANEAHFRFIPPDVDWARVRREWAKQRFSYGKLAKAIGVHKRSVERAVGGYKSNGSAYMAICEFFVNNGYGLPEKGTKK